MSDDVDIDAAEFVLGTLDPAERAAFADRLKSDTVAKRAVTAWEQRFAGLAGRIDPVAPPPHVWARIDAAMRAPGARTQAFEVVDGGGLFADRAAGTLQASRNRWRAAALLSGSIAAALLVFIGQKQVNDAGTGSGDITYVAAVNRGGDKPALLIRVDLKTRQVYVRPVAADAPAGHSLELWYIGDNKPPRSMGVLDQAPSTLAIPQGANATAATFAVSVEPPGGSKTGGPTGPVVYSGQLIKE